VKNCLNAHTFSPSKQAKRRLIWEDSDTTTSGSQTIYLGSITFLKAFLSEEGIFKQVSLLTWYMDVGKPQAAGDTRNFGDRRHH
jgi:hypothetical protein